MLNFNEMFTLVESGGAYGGYLPESYDPDVDEGIFDGPFSIDMCGAVEVAMHETVEEFNEFTTGANELMLEAAMHRNADQLRVLQEASMSGIVERIKGALKKFAKFVKKLVYRFAAFVTAQVGATEQWLKVHEKNVKNAKGTVNKTIINWTVDKLKQFTDTLKVDKCKEIIDGFTVEKLRNGDYADYADKKEATKKIYSDIFGNVGYSEVEGKGDFDKVIDKILGKEEKLSVGDKRNDFLAVIKETKKKLEEVSKNGKKISEAAEKAAQKWDNRKDVDKETADQTKAASGIMNALSAISSGYTRYMGLVRKAISKGAKDCMNACNALVNKKEGDD